jgi:hypothetical protein
MQSKWLCLIPLLANLEKSVRFSIAKNSRVTAVICNFLVLVASNLQVRLH